MALNRELITAFNNDGTAAWNLPVPAPNVLDGLRAIANAPDGALWVMQQIDDGQSVLHNVNSAGSVVAAFGVDAWAHLVVADAVGNVFLRPSEAEGVFAKHDETLDRVWVTDLGGSSGDSARFAKVDRQRQAILQDLNGDVVKLAP